MNGSARLVLVALSVGTLSATAGCGSPSSPGGSSGGGGTTPPVANTVPITAGPGPSTANPYTDGAFVSVTVCVPGSSSQCVNVDNVLLDTGSSGLRILSSALANLPLPNVTTSGGAVVANCMQYVDLTYTWGPVATADVKMAGEAASAVPIQIIQGPGAGFPAAPAGCSNGGVANNTVDTLSANGVLGVSFYLQDCGDACGPGTVSNAGFYYACAGGTCQTATVAVTSQVGNPVASFTSDNNGLLVSLPTLPASGAPSTLGTLTFGIGTQTNNALGGAVVQTPDAAGNLTTEFKGASYTSSFIDSGSNGLYFLDSRTTGLPGCTSLQGYYCPSSAQSLVATNLGANSKSATVSFRVANAETLPAANWVFDDLAGTSSMGQSANGLPALYFDWGLPFFFGRTVYVAIEGRSTSGGTGPYWAY